MPTLVAAVSFIWIIEPNPATGKANRRAGPDCFVIPSCIGGVGAQQDRGSHPSSGNFVHELLDEARHPLKRRIKPYSAVPLGGLRIPVIADRDSDDRGQR